MQLTIDFQTVNELRQKLNELTNLYQVTVNQENHLHIAQPTKAPSYKGKRWTQYEIDNVKHWYENKTYTAKEMAKALGRTPVSVHQLIYKMTKNGLRRRTNRAGEVIISQQ
jgi:hypothetical protein